MYERLCVGHEKGNEPVKDELVRGNVLVGKEQRRGLFHLLLDERISFREWTRQHSTAYLKEKEPKGKRRRGKGA
jgi:hypothetical protein